MRSRIALVSVAVLALAAAGCGSSKKSTTTTSSIGATTPSTGATSANAKVVPRTYRVALAGANEVPKGAPNGSGTAVISIRTKNNPHLPPALRGPALCWTFTNLKNVTAPTVAHIHKGAAGTSGNVVIPFDGKYRAFACVAKADPTMLAQIEANPKEFYVNVHNAAYPGGAVRGQL